MGLAAFSSAGSEDAGATDLEMVDRALDCLANRKAAATAALRMAMVALF